MDSVDSIDSTSGYVFSGKQPNKCAKIYDDRLYVASFKISDACLSLEAFTKSYIEDETYGSWSERKEASKSLIQAIDDMKRAMCRIQGLTHFGGCI